MDLNGYIMSELYFSERETHPLPFPGVFYISQKSCLQIALTKPFFLAFQYSRKDKNPLVLKVVEKRPFHPLQTLEINIGHNEIKFFLKITDVTLFYPDQTRYMVLLHVFYGVLHGGSINVYAPHLFCSALGRDDPDATEPF